MVKRSLGWGLFQRKVRKKGKVIQELQLVNGASMNVRPINFVEPSIAKAMDSHLVGNDASFSGIGSSKKGYKSVGPNKKKGKRLKKLCWKKKR